MSICIQSFFRAFDMHATCYCYVAINMWYSLTVGYIDIDNKYEPTFQDFKVNLKRNGSPALNATNHHDFTEIA